MTEKKTSYAAVRDYLPNFALMPQGVCLHMEAVGHAINARYRDAKVCTFVFNSLCSLLKFVYIDRERIDRKEEEWNCIKERKREREK